MADSVKISDLTEIGVGALDDNSIVPVVDGGTTYKLPISKLKTFIAESFATDSELSAQVVIINNAISALDTSDISENGNLYYTNARVDERLNAYVIISGSSQISDLGFITTTVDISELNSFTESFYNVNIVSSSAQITELLPQGVVSGSSQIVLANADTTGFTTLNVAEGAGIGALYYTDARVKAKLDAEGVISGSTSVPQGTISGSQQITDLGFVSESVNSVVVELLSSSYNSDYAIISQSNNAVLGNPSNLKFGRLWIDDDGVVPLTFTAFSQSVDSRILSAGGGGGTTDYISNVTFAGTTMTFTGTGNAFNSTVDLSGQDLALTSDIAGLLSTTYYETDSASFASRIDSIAGGGGAEIPQGTISGSQQITDFGFISSSEGITYITSSGDVVLAYADNTGFDTSFVPEDIGQTRIYYTDARVESKLNSLGVVSGSITGSILSTENNTVVSSSQQIDYTLISNTLEFYSGSDAVIITSGSAAYGKQWVQIGVSGIGGAGDGYVSNVTFAGSTLSFTGVLNGFDGGVDLTTGDLVDINAVYSSIAPLSDWTGSGGGFEIASQSINNRIDAVESLALAGVPNGTVSGSTQIDYPSITNKPVFTSNNGLLLNTEIDDAGFTHYHFSQSFTRNWNEITNVPAGLETIESFGLYNSINHLGFAQTGSANHFFGAQGFDSQINTPNILVTSSLAIFAGGVIRVNGGNPADIVQMTGSFKLTGSIEADEFIIGSAGTPSITSANNLEISASADISMTATNLIVSASVDIGDTLKLKSWNPLPTGELGMLAVSASIGGVGGLYFHNGTIWQSVTLT